MTIMKPSCFVHQLAQGIRSTSNQDGGTVLDIAGNRIFRVNAMAALILECVRQGWGEARIVAHIGTRYSINEDIARTDVHEFMEALNRHKLLCTAKGREES